MPHTISTLRLAVLAALSMSVGWGLRGDYGHEAGAMMPGALLGLALCLAAGRADWLSRALTIAAACAIGWAFGGQMSYGIVIGYTADSAWANVLYGYANLFVIGALWGAVGAGILGLSLTLRRTELDAIVAPLLAVYAVWKLLDFSGATAWLEARWNPYDTDWVAASSALLIAAICAALIPKARAACRFIITLAAGWLIGFGLLTVTLHLRMTPPRSDNWAGCVGLCAALCLYLWRTHQRAALSLVAYGALAGGAGFAIGAFVQMLGRANWGLIGRFPALQGLGYWKWMEQLFGLLMGAGVALGLARLASLNLAPPEEDATKGCSHDAALLFLLVVIPWENFPRNVSRWVADGHLGDPLFGLTPARWFALIAVLLTLLVIAALRRYRAGALPLIPAAPFPRVQALYLSLLWFFLAVDFTQAFPTMKERAVLLVHVSFWLTALACTWLTIALPAPADVLEGEPRNAEDAVWTRGRFFWLAWALAPLLIFALAWLTLGTHDALLPGSQQRF
ncbi:MAG: hypothetical protein HYR56_32130 [Acidobacteria bacterium]|nr:hypothetical protein [Acidobacteriota bacterium]MBI3427586.1 hypothetical protein [Acidobacteriota bacterium]